MIKELNIRILYLQRQLEHAEEQERAAKEDVEELQLAGITAEAVADLQHQLEECESHGNQLAFQHGLQAAEIVQQREHLEQAVQVLQTAEEARRVLAEEVGRLRAAGLSHAGENTAGPYTRAQIEYLLETQRQRLESAEQARTAAMDEIQRLSVGITEAEDEYVVLRSNIQLARQQQRLEAIEPVRNGAARQFEVLTPIANPSATLLSMREYVWDGNATRRDKSREFWNFR